MSVFRACFSTLELVLDSHRSAVKAFADEALNTWLPFFIDTMKTQLPPTPSEQEELRDGGPQEEWRGLIALKLQVVKTLMKIRIVFPAVLSPQTPILFSTTWHELSSLQAPYHQLYITDERQGRLEDADGLPYTLDFLVLEELDFMQSCLRAPPVRKELEKQLRSHDDATPQAPWLTEVMKLAIAYAQITTEEEGLWDIDVNVFLSEETSVTANYTPRTACGDLVIKLGEWLETMTTQSLLDYTTTLFSDAQRYVKAVARTPPGMLTSRSTWKAREAALYILNQLLGDFQDVDRKISPEASNDFAKYIEFSQQQGRRGSIPQDVSR